MNYNEIWGPVTTKNHDNELWGKIGIYDEIWEPNINKYQDDEILWNMASTQVHKYSN